MKENQDAIDESLSGLDSGERNNLITVALQLPKASKRSENDLLIRKIDDSFSEDYSFFSKDAREPNPIIRAHQGDATDLTKLGFTKISVEPTEYKLDADASEVYKKLGNATEHHKAFLLITELLRRSSGTGDPVIAQNFLKALCSKIPKERQCADRILKLLGADDQNDTLAILRLTRGLNLHQQDSPALIALVEKGGDSAILKSILSLIARQDDTSFDAARNLLRALNTKGILLDNALTVTKKLNSREQPDDVVAALSKLSDPMQLINYLQVVGSPEMTTAAKELTAKLQDAKNGAVAKDVLRSLDSNLPIDKADGNELLNMINNQNGTIRSSAWKLIDSVPDVFERNKVLRVISDPSMSTASAALLDWLGSNVPNTRNAARKLVSILPTEERVANPINKDETPIAHFLLAMANKDKSGQDCCLSLIARTNHWQLNQIQQLMSLDAKAGQTIISWLAGNDSSKQNAAAVYLNCSHTTQIELSQSLGTDKGQKQVVSLLNGGNAGCRLAFPKVIDNLINLRGETDPNLQRGLRLIEEYLVSNRPTDQVIAQRALSAYSYPSHSEDALNLIKMLGHSDTQEQAKEMLRVVMQPAQREKLLVIHCLNRQLGQTLLKLLDSNDSKPLLNVVEAALPLPGNEIFDVGKIAKFVDIVKSPDKAMAADKLKTTVHPSGVASLMKLLTSTAKDELTAGEKILANLNSKSFKQEYVALLNGGLSPRDLVAAMAQEKTDPPSFSSLVRASKGSPNERGLARDVCRMLNENYDFRNPNAKRLLGIMGNKDYAEKLNKLVSHFDTDLSYEDRLHRLNLFGQRVRFPPDRARCFELLNMADNNAKAAQALLTMWLSSSEQTSKAAKKLLDLRLSDNAAEHRLGINLSQHLETPKFQLADFFSYAEAKENNPASDLRAWNWFVSKMGSSDIDDQKAAVRLSILLRQDSEESRRPTGNTQAGEMLVGMLCSARHKKLAEGILRNLDVKGIIDFTWMASFDAKSRMPTPELDRLFPHMGVSDCLSAWLQSPNPKDGEVVRKLLTVDNMSRNAAVKHLWANKNKFSFARDVLELAENPSQIEYVLRMLQTQQGEKVLRQTLQLCGTAEGKKFAAKLISAELRDDEASELLKRVTNSQTKQGAERLLSQIVIENGASPFFGDAGRQLLHMLSDQKKKDAGESLLLYWSNHPTRVPLQAHVVFASIFSRTDLQVSAANIKSLIESKEPSDNEAATRLACLLQSHSVKSREIGEELVLMLNNERHRSAAIRRLKENEQGT